MIEDPQPKDWKDLQKGVARIFEEIGFEVETEKVVDTPRGRIEVDVFAIDHSGSDGIVYIVECKNWQKSVNQEVVHAFTTVMHETGANVGLIVSRTGLQAGATGYTQSTNIRGMTYGEFQAKYFPMWFERFFASTLDNAADDLLQYVELFNSRRDREVATLTESNRERFETLKNRFSGFGLAMAFFRLCEFNKVLGMPDIPFVDDIERIKKYVQDSPDGNVRVNSTYFRDALIELLATVGKITNEFNEIFGRNIFR
jgi:restriction system protein